MTILLRILHFSAKMSIFFCSFVHYMKTLKEQQRRTFLRPTNDGRSTLLRHSYDNTPIAPHYPNDSLTLLERKTGIKTTLSSRFQLPIVLLEVEIRVGNELNTICWSHVRNSSDGNLCRFLVRAIIAQKVPLLVLLK